MRTTRASQPQQCGSVRKKCSCDQRRSSGPPCLESQAACFTLSCCREWHDLPSKDGQLSVTPVVAYMGDIDPCQFASSFNPAEVCAFSAVSRPNQTNHLVYAGCRSFHGCHCRPHGPKQAQHDGALRYVAHSTYTARHTTPHTTAFDRPSAFALGVAYPVFNAGPHRIWGLTAFVLAGVLNTVVLPRASAAKL